MLKRLPYHDGEDRNARDQRRRRENERSRLRERRDPCRGPTEPGWYQRNPIGHNYSTRVDGKRFEDTVGYQYMVGPPSTTERRIRKDAGRKEMPEEMPEEMPKERNAERKDTVSGEARQKVLRVRDAGGLVEGGGAARVRQRSRYV